jgi:3-oxoadipate enol-lactonase
VSLPRLESFVGGLAGASGAPDAPDAPDAPWVTFVPGIGNDASFWQQQADDVAGKFRTVRFEPWGCGASEAPPADCSIAAIADGIVALWDQLGIARSSVIGVGFGGSTALTIAFRHPTRVDRVVACCCRPRQPDDRRQFWRDRHALAQQDGLSALTDMTVDRWLSPEFRSQHPTTDAYLRTAMRRNSVAGYCAYVGAFAEMDFESELGLCTAPTLLIAAENDHGGGPLASMQAMLQRLPNARLHVIAGSGHLCNHEAPAEVSRLILRHLLGATEEV